MHNIDSPFIPSMKKFVDFLSLPALVHHSSLSFSLLLLLSPLLVMLNIIINKASTEAADDVGRWAERRSSATRWTNVYNFVCWNLWCVCVCVCDCRHLLWFAMPFSVLYLLPSRCIDVQPPALPHTLIRGLHCSSNSFFSPNFLSSPRSKMKELTSFFIYSVSFSLSTLVVFSPQSFQNAVKKTHRLFIIVVTYTSPLIVLLLQWFIHLGLNRYRIQLFWSILH